MVIRAWKSILFIKLYLQVTGSEWRRPKGCLQTSRLEDADRSCREVFKVERAFRWRFAQRNSQEWSRWMGKVRRPTAFTLHYITCNVLERQNCFDGLKKKKRPYGAPPLTVSDTSRPSDRCLLSTYTHTLTWEIASLCRRREEHEEHS